MQLEFKLFDGKFLVGKGRLVVFEFLIFLFDLSLEVLFLAGQRFCQFFEPPYFVVQLLDNYFLLQIYVVFKFEALGQVVQVTLGLVVITFVGFCVFQNLNF